MSSEPLTSSTAPVEADASAERVLLIAMLVMVLLGTTAMFFML
jgi:hypothetical protein